jgi:nucleoid-associated protein Lsr2
MAQRIQMLLIDDLDGGEAAGTVRFGLDGTEYEIDLSAAHSDELRKALELYLAHARRAGGTARNATRTRRASAAVDTAKVRDWAKRQGIKIKDRGRVPAGVVEQYQTATGA